jgi:Type IV secretion-system coupling protein DNA-binding domain
MASIFNPIIVIFQLFFTLLIGYYLWVPLVAVIIFFIWQNNRKTKWVSDSETVLLLIEVPKDNDKKELSAEQMFASLHGILRPKSEIIKEGRVQEHISFEIVARNKTIQFYAWTPKHLKDFVESQIYAQYPTVQIKDGAEDYSKIGTNDRSIYGTELMLNKSEVLPLKTFTSFEVDPLAGITGVLSKLDQPGEEAWIQVLARPTDDDWQEKGKSYIEKLKGGSPSMPPEYHLLNGTFKFIGELLNAFWSVPQEGKSDGKKDEKKPEPSTGQQTMMKAVEEKITKLGYEVKIRIVYLGPDETTGRQRLQALVGGFKQFNTTNLNGFNAKKYYDSEKFVHDYQSRLFYDRGYTLNIEELASLYHLPHLSVETPNMVWTTTKTSEPPSNIPLEDVEDPTSVSLFGLTNFRGNHQKFGIKRQDRGRHTYIIGQTGAGKSFMLQLLTLSDVYHNQGFAIIDPHGDFATDMMKYIPEHRLKDVVYLNPADRDFPMAFNPMEVTDEAVKDHISSELVGVLKRMFESWGPRLEYILRYTILALLDFEGATMLDITRMLNEKDFRKQVIAQIQDPVVKSFWITEFASWNEKFASEAVAPVLNKVGAFVANPLVRNIVGQQKSAFNIREIMDQGKILIVNLSRGQVGEDNAAILGALMVTKIQLAAMSRSDMDISKRRPFYLYVDEFQNFATDSFAVILSEARKYGLNLTVANQYISQMPEVVRDAVFGNVGTMISFRVGPVDSVVLGKYFEPVFEMSDLTRLNNQNIFISMIIDGEKALPFSARTLRMPDPSDDLSDEIIRLSRENFASKRADVELDIRGRTAGPDMNDTRHPQQNNQSPVDKQPNHAATQSNHKEQEPNIPKSEFLANLKNPDAPKPHTSQNSYNKPPNNRNTKNHSNQHPQGREQHRSAQNTPQTINSNDSHQNLDHVVAPADTLNK